MSSEPTAEQLARITERAHFVREETVRLISLAKTGHYASTFSCAEILAVLYYDVLRLRRGEPDATGRDRFLMGKGHAAVGLYPLLADWDFLDPALLDEYTSLGNPLGDHPDMRIVPGVDFSSGSLGHALSAGLGMALGARMQALDFRVFVLLGDGELNEGQVWEAAMAAAHQRARNLVAIVDRNGYSLDGQVDDGMGIEPLNDKWRAFGWEVHEVDGHDVGALVRTLRGIGDDEARERPAVVIAHTVKGKGIGYMEEEFGWHVGWLDAEDERAAFEELAAMTATRDGQRSWHVKQLLDLAPGLQALGNTLADLADAGHPVAVATADLKYSNGTVLFERRHPERFLQFGIAEQNMATASAGLATTGMLPYAVSFASFIALLCCEQLRTDAAYTNLPVRFVGTHAGITLGFYGSSHHATEDLAITRSIANLDVVAPADTAALSAALWATVEHPRPLYFRIGRGRDPVVYGDGIDFELGRAIVHRQGGDLTIIATGSTVHPALAAARALEAEAHAVGVIDMHTISPLDRAAVLAAAAGSAQLMTVEEHNVTGGLGGAVAEVLADAGAGTPLHRHGIRDEYSLIGPPTHLYAHYKLDGAGIAAEAREVLGLA